MSTPINEVNIPNVVIPKFQTNEVWLNGIPFIPHNHAPVSLQIGFPIVDMPGCVEMHKDNRDHVSRLPIDKDLVNQDPKGSTTLCPHGEYPSFNAMDYQPEQLIIKKETPPPPVSPPPEVEPPTPPDTSKVGGEKEETPCPAPNQPRVGDLTQNGEERVIGHELQGTTCVVLYEPTTAVEKYLPSTNQATTTAAIAVVATASAAATPILLRIFKPVITKLWKTIQKKLGKKPYEPSKSEKEANKYREKKGLPPLKPPKKRKK
tara:strand:+ start:47 stop:832 length:786 start_codon:yes stop_codon:yes gene_type:complete